jgi:hypothetical protein
MKRLMISMTMMALIAAATSCTRNNTASGTDDFTTTNPPSGSYKISFYWDKKDETSDYNGYTFEFAAGGVLKATRAGTVTNGTWSENATSQRFNISFPSAPLSELSDNWLIQEKTPNTLKLKDDNPAQDDQLHFTKL